MENSRQEENKIVQEVSAAGADGEDKLVRYHYHNWLIPTVSGGLVLMVFFMMALSNWDEAHVRAVTTVTFWAMIVGAFAFPIAKIKKDKAYGFVSMIPLEIVGIVTFIVWQLVYNSIGLGASVQFFGLLFLGLCLLGYLVSFVKDIYQDKDKIFKDHMLWFKVYHKYVKVNLKQNQNVKIFIVLLIQPLFFLVLALSVLDVWYVYDPVVFIIAVIIIYMVVAFFSIRYLVSKVQEDYNKVHQLIRNVAEGNFIEEISEDLGIFNELKGELEHAGAGLASAVQQAVASERMKGELIANVTLDLKSPLISIIGYIDLLQNDEIDKALQKQYLQTLAVRTDRLKTLVDDLFEVSKAVTGDMTMDFMDIDVVTLMKQTLQGLAGLIEESGLVLREAYPDEPVMLTLDPGRMQRVFENLLINIVKYAIPRTRAYVDIIDCDAQVDIILRNISAHELHVESNDSAGRVVRENETQATEGSGLGLAIAKSFVHLQGGTFEILVDGDLFKVVITFCKRVNK